MSESKNIVVATIKSWNIRLAEKLQKELEGKYNVYIITKKEDLSSENLENIRPIYIFFPHWSWIIPPEVYMRFECIGFHITDLPYGRGGSPLQNLILRKKHETKITAFRIGRDIDAGEIYLKVPFYIGLGSAEEIFIKASEIIFTKMIPQILESRPIPVPQTGEVVIFKRRSPEESNLAGTDIKNLDDFYDFIRMLDAEGYPRAFIKVNNVVILFSEAHKKERKVVGRFEAIEE